MSTAPWPGCWGRSRRPGGPLVMDRGVATEDRIGWLREEGYRYVRLAVRPRGGPDLGDRFQGQVTVAQGGFRRQVRLYCRSEERAHKERGIVERFSRRFEGAPRLPRDSHGRGLIEKVRERIGRLKEQSRGLANTTRSGPHRRQRPQGDGPDLEAPAPPGLFRASTACAATRLGRGEPVAHLHHSHRRGSGVSLPEVRTGSAPHLSSQAGALGRPPVPDRHRLSTGAGLRKRLKQRGDSSSWTTLRRILEGQQRVTVTFRRGDGRTLHVRKATRAETDQKAIYLGIDPAPGGVRKMIV